MLFKDRKRQLVATLALSLAQSVTLSFAASLAMIFLLIAPVRAGAQALSATGVSIEALSKPVARTELASVLGPSAVRLDSLSTNGPTWTGTGQFLYAPVLFAGVPSIGKALLDHDTLTRIEFSLPYRAHRNMKPEEPYVYHGFVKATPDDLQHLLSAMIAQFGDPSVASEAFFEYLSTDTRPMIVARYKDHLITVTVTPLGK